MDGYDCPTCGKPLRQFPLNHLAECAAGIVPKVVAVVKKESSSDLDILRRIAERGLKLAQSEGPQFVDIFQHMIDEIGRVVLETK